LKYPITTELAALLNSIRAAGGRPLLVGGGVRDVLMSNVPKDIDIEVFGLAADKLKAALIPHGQVFAVGVSFAVLKVYLRNGQELDIALPRRESHGGERGAIPTPDPNMTPQEACSRRDFTLNAMAYDPATDEILDFFGGQADLAAGILRHVGASFADDPLRVLRGMQFAARWNFRLAPETAAFCAGLLPQFPKLARERVWGEWLKYCEKSHKPSAGLNVLEQTQWRQAFGALATLSGESWQKTLATTDNAEIICRRDKLMGTDRIVLLLAATGGYTADIKAFLGQINCPQQYAKVITPLVREMQNWQNVSPTPTAVRWLSKRLAPANIVGFEQLAEAVFSPVRPLTHWLEIARALGCADRALPPLLLGRHLEEAGLSPSPRFKAILDAGYTAQLDGVFDTLDGAKLWLREHLQGS
jgi:tRNA nucleotidyltransferase (CCA-adding enzyme)